MTVTNATTAGRTAMYRPFAVRLVTRQQLSPSFVRLTFAGDDLASCGATCLDQRIKLVFADDDQIDAALANGDDWYAWWLAEQDDRPAMRTYTLRAVRAEQSAVDVDFACHGAGGPASAFAVDAPLGSRLLLVGPNAAVAGSELAGVAWQPGEATEVMLAGDETGAPAICGIVERLPAETTGRVLVEVPTIEDALQLSAPAGVVVTWLARGDRPHGEVLRRAVSVWAGSAPGAPDPDADEQEGAAPEELLWEEAEASGGRYLWVAGEAGMVAGIRRLLVHEHGIDRRACSFMGYWKVGRAG